MKRRIFLSALAAVALSACASAQGVQQTTAPPASGFASDRITVATQGAGPDVILIPGLTSSPEVWATTADALDDRYRVHLVHVNGFAGRAPGANAEGPVSAPVAEEIARYIRENNLRQPAVIGHSMGGTIGMMLAARHPDSVGKLMVVDMFPWMGAMFGPPGSTADSVRPIADQIRNQWAAAPDGQVSPFVEQMVSSMVRTEGARPMVLGHTRASSNDVAANAFHELIVTDLRAELPNIRAPMTVLYVAPPNLPMPAAQYEGYMRASYTNVPSTRIVKIDDSYHFIMIDQFDRFMGEVNAFLAP